MDETKRSRKWMGLGIRRKYNTWELYNAKAGLLMKLLEIGGNG